MHRVKIDNEYADVIEDIIISTSLELMQSTKQMLYFYTDEHASSKTDLSIIIQTNQYQK